MKRKTINTAVKYFIGSVIILLAIFLIVGYIWSIISSSRYFLVREVFTRQGNTQDVTYLIGKNIFALDLKRESAFLKRSYPDCRSVSITRILPNRLFVDFLRRKPVAMVKFVKLYEVDEDGFIFLSRAQDSSRLPVIKGLEKRIRNIENGSRYSLKELDSALQIIASVNKRSFKHFCLGSIDVSHPASTVVVFVPCELFLGQQYEAATAENSQVQVKIGQDDIDEKIGIVANLLEQARQGNEMISYIDVRFNEPVMKLRQPEKTKNAN